MPGSTRSVFSDPDDFQDALKEDGCVELVVTARGRFWAGLSRISLHRMRLTGAEERHSRVAFVSVPSRFVRVTLPTQPGMSMMSSGVDIKTNEIVTHSPGHRFHERIHGPCHWSTMWFLPFDLADAGRTISGSLFTVPSGEHRWAPHPRTLRSLIDLHSNALHATAANLHLPVRDAAAHGLEQQLLLAVMQCLMGRPAAQGTGEQAEIMGRFEDFLLGPEAASSSVAEIAAALGISATQLRRRCQASLGMSPARYIYLRRMRQVRRCLLAADHTKVTVTEIAQRHGFDYGGFPKAYRLLFGELPALTLRRRTVP